MVATGRAGDGVSRGIERCPYETCPGAVCSVIPAIHYNYFMDISLYFHAAAAAMASDDESFFASIDAAAAATTSLLTWPHHRDNRPNPV